MKTLIVLLVLGLASVAWGQGTILQGTPHWGPDRIECDNAEWLGMPFFGKDGPGDCIDPGFSPGGCPPGQYYRTDIEIGLCPNGLVVWRKVEPKKEGEKK